MGGGVGWGGAGTEGGGPTPKVLGGTVPSIAPCPPGFDTATPVFLTVDFALYSSET